jgi:hypothetical protein
VHVLHLRTIAEVRAEVQALERLAIRAFGTDDARAAVAGDLTPADAQGTSASTRVATGEDAP